VAVVGIGGLFVGLHLRPATPPAAAPEARPSSVASTQPPIDQQQLAAEIRAVVREELARNHNEAPAPNQEPPPAAALPTVEQVTAQDQAHAVVDGARRSGHWTEEDRAQLRQQLPQMSDAQRDEVLTTLIPAINRQEIKIDVRGAPF
jgi:hypothetical protein